MARAGRKRKQGNRTKSGQLSREGQPRLKIVKGNDRALMMQALYGTNGTDAIGRAFEAGLLGQGTEAQSLLDTARSMAKAYWAAYVEHPPHCTLADSAGGALLDLERVKRREQWLNMQLAIVDAMGHSTRRLFDHLVIDLMPDAGPSWLDNLIFAKRSGKAIDAAWQSQFDRALSALKAIAS